MNVNIISNIVYWQQSCYNDNDSGVLIIWSVFVLLRSHSSLHCRLLYLLLLAAGSFLMAAMLTPSLQHQLQSAFKGQSPTSKARLVIIEGLLLLIILLDSFTFCIITPVLGSWFKTGGKIKSFEIL